MNVEIEEKLQRNEVIAAVEAMGGTIDFESSADKGTTFTVKLPL
jgi:signal transduction histidine kinase